MSDAAAQLKRILALIPQIADGEERSLDELAASLGVDAQTVLKDLESIATRFEEPAGGFIEPLRIFIDAAQVSVTADHFLRPMRLTVPELRALQLGLALLRSERPRDEHAAIDRARQRIQKAVVATPDLPEADAAHHLESPAVRDPKILATIRQALRENRKLEIRYRKGDATESSERVICPYELVIARGSWYLAAQCDAGEALRVFRLDRIESAELQRERFELPKAFSAAELMKQGRAFVSDAPSALRVRYSARIARWIAEREGGTLEADGSLVVDHPLADPEWAVRHVLQYGPEAEVVAPESVREAVRRRLEDLRQYIQSH
jgi:proteasome accessory factor C